MGNNQQNGETKKQVKKIRKTTYIETHNFKLTHAML